MSGKKNSSSVDGPAFWTAVAVGGAASAAAVAWWLWRRPLASGSSSGSAPEPAAADADADHGLVVLAGGSTRRVKLVDKLHITSNTRLFRFALPSSAHTLGLGVGQHVMVSATIDGELVERPYTPTTPGHAAGHFDLVVRIYDQGVMTRYLDSLTVGRTVAIRGPLGSFEYRPRAYRAIGMVAGGTGITPMYQILSAVLADAEDRTQVSLLYASVSIDQIVLRPELDAMVAANHHRALRLRYTVDQAPAADPATAGWQHGVGRVSEEACRAHLPAVAPDACVYVCGPPRFMDAVKAILTHTIGWPEAQVRLFGWD